MNTVCFSPCFSWFVLLPDSLSCFFEDFSLICFTHAAPFQSPLDFRVTASTFHSVTLEWDMPPLASWNGILTHYSMTYTLINSAASPCNHSLNESRVVPVDRRRNVETVDDLIPFHSVLVPDICRDTFRGRPCGVVAMQHNTGR